MKPSVFIDSSVFILAKKFPASNSAKIVELLANDEIDATISAKVLQELTSYFKRTQNKNVASDYRFFLIQSCRIIEKEEILPEIQKWKNRIKKKDLEHLATVKAMSIKYLIAYDRDYRPFQEYITPKQFIKSLGLTPAETEF